MIITLSSGLFFEGEIKDNIKENLAEQILQSGEIVFIVPFADGTGLDLLASFVNAINKREICGFYTKADYFVVRVPYSSIFSIQV